VAPPPRREAVRDGVADEVVPADDGARVLLAEDDAVAVLGRDGGPGIAVAVRGPCRVALSLVGATLARGMAGAGAVAVAGRGARCEQERAVGRDQDAAVGYRGAVAALCGAGGGRAALLLRSARRDPGRTPPRPRAPRGRPGALPTGRRVAVGLRAPKEG
jgi:hypothetical protein